MTRKFDVYNFIVLLTLLLSIIIAGGFYEYVSCFISIILISFFVCYCVKNNKWKFTVDINYWAVALVVISYLFVSLWAVDKGMSTVGFFKFIPILLFFILISTCDNKEKYIGLLPMIGTLMTLYSFIMMQFNSLCHLVSVADRMSGTFQYPNTFALFLLICLILSFYSEEKDNIVNIVILLFGIYKSGSLTVYILTVVTLISLIIIHKSSRKPIMILSVAVLVVGGILILTGNINLDISLKSSTFLGRLLYYRDALPVIISHPAGLGYYGYYFVQPSIQTGVYSVLNVHNEVLQLMLDIGIIPTLVFFYVIIRQLFIKEQSNRNKLVIVMIVLHSLLDYDFQFVSILLILTLFLKTKPITEIKVSKFSKIAVITILCLLVCGSLLYGISNWYFMRGEYGKAYAVCNANTRAQIQQMYVTDDIVEQKNLAEAIIHKNDNISIAYSIIADNKYIEGDVDGYIQNKLKAIELAPYDYSLYLDYLNTLSATCDRYIAIGELDSAEICLDRMKSVKNMLKKVEEKTSELAWEIQDIPMVILPPEYESLINELELRVYE